MKPSGQKKIKSLGEKGFRAIIEHAHEGFVIYNPKGKIIFASKSVRKVCGFREEEILGKSGKAFIHPDDLGQASEAFLKLVTKPGKSITLFQRIRHKKGHYIWAESLLTNFIHMPEVNGIVSNFRDITAKKAAEDQALQSRKLLEAINSNLSEGIYMGVIGVNFLYVNNAFLRMFGYKSLQEVQRIKPSEVYADAKARNKIVEQLKEHQTLKGVETLFRRKNGETFSGMLHVSIMNHNGDANYFVGTIVDITKDKKAAAALLESRNFLNNIINTVAAPIFVKDARHRWIMFNDRFASLIGKSQEELRGKTDKSFLPPDEVKVFWSIDNKVLRTGKTISNLERITSKKGKVHDLLTIKSLYINEKSEKFIIGFITDITELKQAEEKINQLNANLQGVVDSTKESIYAVDTSFNYLIFNQNHKRIMRLLYGANIETGHNKLLHIRRSKDYTWVKAEIQKALHGNNFVSEHYLDYPGYKGYIQSTYNPIRNSKGEIRGVAVFIADITPRKQFEEIIQANNANLTGVLESTTDHVLAIDRNFGYISFNKAHADFFGANFTTEIKKGNSLLKVLPPDLRKNARQSIGKVLRGQRMIVEEQVVKDIIFEVSFNPIHNEKKVVTGVAIFARDITHRKNIEGKLKSLNHELVEQNLQLAAQEEELKVAMEELSERNFELDQLMYKTSHDLRSPLSSIMGLVNLANLEPDPSDLKQYFSKIEGRVKKLDDFIKSMLDYARVNRVEIARVKIKLKDVALNCLRELEYLDNYHALKVSITTQEKLPVFIGDPLRINIIFSNIISNAFKYYNAEVKSYLKINIRITRQQAVIEFRDNGIGIKEEHMSKIFNMFYRATDRSQGSGLGMYIVKQAVEKLDGQIAISSVYGKGTHIKITLPHQNSAIDGKSVG